MSQANLQFPRHSLDPQLFANQSQISACEKHYPVARTDQSRAEDESFRMKESYSLSVLLPIHARITVCHRRYANDAVTCPSLMPMAHSAGVSRLYTLSATTLLLAAKSYLLNQRLRFPIPKRRYSLQDVELAQRRICLGGAQVDQHLHSGRRALDVLVFARKIHFQIVYGNAHGPPQQSSSWPPPDMTSRSNDLRILKRFEEK